MSQDKSPVEKAIELAVYAPIGFANFIRTMLPGWIEGGRTEVAKQMTNAKAISEIALAQGRNEAEKAVSQAAEVVSSLQGRRQPSPPPAPRPTPAPTTAATPSTASSPPSANGPRPNGDALAIPGYDSLAASQVVQRLGGLSTEDLEAVRAYEAATRGRRTILNRIGQLQAETNQ